MPGFTTLGVNSKNTFLAENKATIYLAFTTSAACFKGQPMKMDGTGKITPLITGDYPSLCIGFALSDGASGSVVTIITRGTAIVWALANAATQATGPVTYKGYDTTHNTGTDGTLGYSLYGASTVEAATTVTTANGWALDVSVAQYDFIRVLLAN